MFYVSPNVDSRTRGGFPGQDAIRALIVTRPVHWKMTMSVDAALGGLNLYDVLGVAPNADPEEVRSAFRSLARILHPDFNPSQDAVQRFVTVAQAYAVLSDPERRRAYDASRRPPPGVPVRSPLVGRPAVVGRGVLRGADVELSITLSLREAAFGTAVRVHVPRREVCAPCRGRGVAEGGTSARCGVCNGTGGTRSGGGECSSCQGSGVKGDPPCPNCLGYGRKRGNTPLTVTIPPAVDDGQQLILKGEGDSGPRNGPRGDLLLRIAVRPDDVLMRSGIDILMNLPLSPHDAEAGCTVEVPTLRGPKKLRIPAGTPDRTVLRIAGAGLRHHGSFHKGDQFVTVAVASSQPDYNEASFSG